VHGEMPAGGRLPAPGGQVEPADAPRVGGSGNPHEPAERRKDVHALDRLGDSLAPRETADRSLVGRTDDEWDVHDLLVERLSVAELPVVAELFAVVGGHDHRSPS